MNTLQYVQDRVIVKVPTDYKNWHTFEDGTKIRMERKYDNFNNRYTQPVNAIVVSAENIPEGADILIHHNSTHDTNLLNNVGQISGNDIASDVRYFSIPVTECFAWKHKGEWQPLQGFDFAWRIFKPYKGVLEGIEPALIKNCLYLYTGDYAGKVGITIKASDYEIIFQDVNGREGNLIRVRTHGDERTQREHEVVAIHDEYTKMIQSGELLVGLTKSDCKPINLYEQRKTTKPDQRITI